MNIEQLLNKNKKLTYVEFFIRVIYNLVCIKSKNNTTYNSILKIQPLCLARKTLGLAGLM